MSNNITCLILGAACGMKLRGDDPVGMKNFIQTVQQRVNELKASSGNRQSNISGKRVIFLQLLLSTVPYIFTSLQ